MFVCIFFLGHYTQKTGQNYHHQSETCHVLSCQTDTTNKHQILTK